jgi:hypothetical protein
MATYKIAYENDGYPDKGSKEIYVHDSKIRAYSTVVNAAIAKVLIQAGILLSMGENGELDEAAMLEKGLKINVEQG